MNRKKYDIVHNVHSIKFGCSLIIFAVAFLAGCSWFQKDEAKLVVINVLDPSYYQDCHITGSVNIPFEKFEDTMKTLRKQDRYVVYCSNHACTAAPFAASMMKDAGFESVALLPGGIVEWYQKKLPYQGPAALQYLQEENVPLVEEKHDSVQVLTPDELYEQLKVAKLV